MKLPLLPQDKANHWVYGSLVACAGTLWGPLQAAILVAVAAFGKEIWDMLGDGTPDGRDASATILGGMVVLLPFAFNHFRSF